jgi:hypothetical protein
MCIEAWAREVSGEIAAGPPALEFPPAVLPALCASANVPVSARTAAATIVASFIGVSSGFIPERITVAVPSSGLQLDRSR